MSAFPMLIKYLSGEDSGVLQVVYLPEQIPKRTDIRVLCTNFSEFSLKNPMDLNGH